MKSSSSVIKSRNQGTASSWLPAELEMSARTDSDLDLTAEDRTHTWLPAELKEIRPGRKNMRGMNLSPESSQEEPDPFAEAKEEAERIIASAKRESDVILLEAREQAHREGYRQGKEAVEQELIDAAEALNALLTRTREWQADFFASGENQVLAVIVLVAEKLFGTGFKLEQEPLQAFLNQVLQRAKSLGDLRCFLNPQDISILENGFLDRQQAFHGVNMTLVPNEEIKPGGCQIEGTFGSVDASIENRFESILDAIRAAHDEGSDSPSADRTKEGNAW